jgi:hypothetical protein
MIRSSDLTYVPFNYTDAQWGRVKQALSRIGLDADQVGVIANSLWSPGWYNHPKLDKKRPQRLRDALHGIGGGYLMYKQHRDAHFLGISGKERLKVLTDAMNKLRAAREALKDPVVAYFLFGVQTSMLQDDKLLNDKGNPTIYAYVKDALERAEALALQTGYRFGNRNMLAPLSEEKYVEILISIYESIGGRVGGNESGPAVAFIKAAAEPFLGENATSLTGSALRARLRRYGASNGNKGVAKRG